MIEKIPVLNKPSWIRGKLSLDDNYSKVKDLLKEKNIKSVCIEATCPNKGECWQARHVTFMILGDICTRGCKFCDVAGGEPNPPDALEPERIAAAIKELGMEYVVITSVSRDDLKDSGAGHFLKVVDKIKEKNPDIMVELLIPDFRCDTKLLRKIAFSGVKVVGHNIEIPEVLYDRVRTKAVYKRSLNVLKVLSDIRNEGADILVKSSIILGLGENEKDIFHMLEDLKDCGVDIVYLGQYLSPSGAHWPVHKYYTPEEFEFFEKETSKMGFKAICSGVMVRSSYRAREFYLKAKSCVS